MPQKDGYLLVAAGEQGCRYALLIRPEVLDTQLAEPRMQGVIATVGATVWGRQVAMPPALLQHPARGDAELSGSGTLDEVEVGFIVRGVVNGLTAQKAAVPDEVSEQAQPALRPPQACADRLRDSPRDGNPAAGRQLLQRSPSGEGQERVIAGCLDLTPGRQLEAVRLLDP